MREHRVDVEDAILRMAAVQYGLVTRGQLMRMGVPPDVLDRRLKTGRLRRVHRGVFLVGPLRAPHTREMAAVLACGESAVVSHRSAATVWQLLARRAGTPPVEVNVVRGDPYRRPGVRVHRIRTLTIFDLASVAGLHDVERALAQAVRRDLTSRDEIVSLLAHHVRHRGTRRLRALLAQQPEAALTRSDAESRFLALVRRAGLPIPATNVPVGGYEVDFFWREERFVVEIDGFAYHSSVAMFDSDRRRDAALAAAGVRVTRITWRQLVSEPEAVLVRLTRALVRNDQT